MKLRGRNQQNLNRKNREVKKRSEQAIFFLRPNCFRLSASSPHLAPEPWIMGGNHGTLIYNIDLGNVRVEDNPFFPL